MFYCEILNNNIKRFTNSEKVAIQNYDKYVIAYFEDFEINRDKYKYDEVANKVIDISDTEEYQEKQLEKAKVEKLAEATSKAYDYIQNEAMFEISPTQHIEATDGNIGKFSALMAGFSGGLIESVPWSTYENENITLNFGEAMTVLQGLLEVQAGVWTVKHNGFVEGINAIVLPEDCTVEDIQEALSKLNDIVIDYTLDEG